MRLDKLLELMEPISPPPITLFSELDLSPVMQEALKRAGFANATPIQSALIPLALNGMDVIGQARTGTAKRPRSRFLSWNNLIR